MMSLRPAKHNFTIWKDATFRVVCELFVNGQPWKDLSEYTAVLTVKKKVESTEEPLLKLTNLNGGIILGDATVTLYLPASATSAITWRTGVYDLLITAPEGGDTDALMRGGFHVLGV